METMREWVRERIGEVLGEGATPAMVFNAETSIYNYTYRRCISKGFPRALGKGSTEAEMFRYVYKNKALSILFNLQNPRNPHFLQSILDRELECRHIAFLSREQIFPELWRPIKEKLAKESRDMLVDSHISEGSSGPIRCTRCRDKGKVSVSILQTRAADEGSTVYCYCHTCCKRWKIAS